MQNVCLHNPEILASEGKKKASACRFKTVLSRLEYCNPDRRVSGPPTWGLYSRLVSCSLRIIVASENELDYMVKVVHGIILTHGREEELQYSTYNWNRIWQEYGFMSSTKKTKFQTFKRNYPVRMKIVIEDVTFKLVSVLKSLGWYVAYHEDIDLDNKLSRFEYYDESLSSLAYTDATTTREKSIIL